jgi:parvulin-like peptidyl-prolyl isomerase
MFKYSIIFLGITLFLLSCTDDSSQDSVLARVGKENITLEQFEKSFVLNPQYSIRTPLRKARSSQIEFLVQQKYYYMAAREVNLANDPVIQNRIRYIKNQEIIKAHIHQKFLNDIKIGEQQLIESLRRVNTKVRIQHLFSENLDETEVLAKRLSEGESFESLAKEIYRDSSLSETGGDLGYIGFGDIDSQLEDRVYEMEIDEISEPVQSAYGFHILKVSDMVQDEQFKEMALPTKISLVNDILRNRQADRAIREYLAELAGNEKIQVNNRILDVLVKATQRVMGKRYSEADLFKPPVRSGDLKQIELSVDDVLDEVLVRFSDQEMQVADFLNRLKQMPPLHRPYLKTRSRMSQAIIDMIRNDLLLEDARKLSLHKSEEVNKTIEDLLKEFLAEEFQKRFYSENFKNSAPQEWQIYADALEHFKDEEKPIFYYENIYDGLGQTDSLMAPEPIPVFLKSKYRW